MLIVIILIILFLLFYTNQHDMKENLRGRRRRVNRRMPTKLSHIGLFPGVSPAEYPWVAEDTPSPVQKRDCSNDIWFPPYYPWYPTSNKSPISQ